MEKRGPRRDGDCEVPSKGKQIIPSFLDKEALSPDQLLAGSRPNIKGSSLISYTRTRLFSSGRAFDLGGKTRDLLWEKSDKELGRTARPVAIPGRRTTSLTRTAAK